jgi:hypothetical protein
MNHQEDQNTMSEDMKPNLLALLEALRTPRLERTVAAPVECAWPILASTPMRSWSAEAMLCTAAPVRSPPPEPADKEEYERLKKADQNFERNYYCADTDEQREKAYEKARACLAARQKVYELAREDVGSDLMGEHLKEMIEVHGLGGSPEFEIGCAYSEQYRKMDEFALYMRVMPDFLDRHYDAGSFWARDQLIREARALLEARLPECPLPSEAGDDDLYA